MRSPPKSSFVQAGSAIASPRVPISRGNAPYRKQQDWQCFVDELSAEHDRTRDGLQRELRQMRDVVAELREEQIDLEQDSIAQNSISQRKLEIASRDLESLQEELHVSKTREIQSKRTLDLNEASNSARCSEMEATIVRLQQAAIADARVSATKEMILQSQLESTRSCEKEAHLAIAAARVDVVEINQRSSEALMAMQSEQIRVEEAAALAKASSTRECEKLEASTVRSQRALEKVQADSKLQQDQFEAKMTLIQNRENDIQGAEMNVQHAKLELQQQLEAQRNEARLDVERIEKQFSSNCQLLEARVKEAEFVCQKKLAAQQSEHQQEFEKKEEAFFARSQRLQAEVDEEKAISVEKLQAQQLEASRAANSANVAFSAKFKQMETRAERATAELRRQKARTEEDLDMNAILAENKLATVESRLLGHTKLIEEALYSSEQSVEHAEKSAQTRQESLKADLQASHHEVIKAKQQIGLEENVALAKCKDMEQQVESSERMVIDAKHELACSKAAAQAQLRQLEAALQHAQKAIETAELHASVQYKDLQSHMSLMQQREMTSMRSLEQSEAMLAKRCSDLEARAQRNQSLEIEAECTEAESIAKAEANHRGLEVVVDQMLWDIGREENASNAKAERLEADLVSVRAEAAAAQETLALQEERMRAGNGPRYLRQIRKPDGASQNVDRSAKSKTAGKDFPSAARQVRLGEKKNKDSPEAGGG